MPDSDKTLALIGAGNWGKNLARNFYALGALHTICDTRKIILDSYQDRYADVALTTDLALVLKNPRITRLAIAAPADQHYQLAKQALLAKKDVLIEKPFCLNVQEAEELIDLAKTNKAVLMVGHLLQYHPCIVRLQELLKNGDLGQLHYITSNRLNLGSIRTEENALWSFAPHDISVILSLCNDQLPKKVRSTGEAYISAGIVDTTMTTMQFNGSVRAHVYVSWLHPFKEQKLVVIGSSGMAVFDDAKPWEEKLLLYRNPITWLRGAVPLANKIEPERLSVPQKEPLQEECLHFLQCCIERAVPKTNGEEGLRVLTVLQAAQESLDEDGSEKTCFSHSPTSYFSHPTAIISSKAEIGQGTKIWHFSHIMENSQIGTSCNIGQNVVVSPGVVLGKNVKVQNNVSIFTGVICEDDAFLGPSVVFTNVINPRSAVNRRREYRQTWVKRGASIGANATILCGIELGEYCFIGAGSVVTKNIPPYAIVVGNPARQIGWMSRYGERLELPVGSSSGRELRAYCSSSGDLYLLREGVLTLENA